MGRKKEREPYVTLKSGRRQREREEIIYKLPKPSNLPNCITLVCISHPENFAEHRTANPANSFELIEPKFSVYEANTLTGTQRAGGSTFSFFSRNSKTRVITIMLHACDMRIITRLSSLGEHDAGVLVSLRWKMSMELR